MNELNLSRQKLGKKIFKMPIWGWIAIGLGAVLLVITIISLIMANSYKKTALAFKAQAEETGSLAKQAYGLFKTQDLPATSDKIQETKTSLEKTKKGFETLKQPLTMTGNKKYYEDGLKVLAAAETGLVLGEKATQIIAPYADMLGFTTEEKVEDGTAEDRVKKILDTLSVVGPELDVVLTDLEKIQSYVDQINPNDYPEKVGDVFGAKMVLKAMGKSDLADFEVRNKLIEVKKLIDLSVNTFKEFRPVIDKLPQMAGADGQRRKYLILFQNNNELRPTGGFLTAYSIIYVENGKVTPEKSDDIYELDKKFTKKIPIPEKLGKYLTSEKYWNLRDMNISPDLSVSMDTFLTNYKLVQGEPQDIDGIIVIDTMVLTDLIDILGPVKVEGYGEFTTEPDTKYGAPEVVIALSEIITRPTPYLREDRKGILGPMMKAILEKVYGAGKEQFPALFTTMLKNINGRHIQAYFLDPELQAAAEKINLAGRMIAPTDGSDFLAVVDANLGGAKSNLFIDYDVNQTVLPPEDGELTKRVVINYRNSKPGDNCNLEAGLLCLNSTNNDWNRVYLPLGAKLISAKGYKGEPTVYEENGFTVIDGFFALNPNSTAKIDLEYTVPYSNPTDYNLKIWQQGGLREVKHLIDVNGNQEEVIVDKDTVYKAKF